MGGGWEAGDEGGGGDGGGGGVVGQVSPKGKEENYFN